MRNSFIRNLSFLQEKKNEMLDEPEMKDEIDNRQAKIADDGSDVDEDPNKAEAEQDPESEPEQEVPEDEEEDYDELEDEFEPDFPEKKDIEVTESQRYLRLYESFDELHNYAKIFYDNLNDININLLDKIEYERMNELKEKMLKNLDKIDDYMRYSFEDKEYEESLYVYILLRTEFLTAIKGLRKVLKLDQKGTKEKKDNKNIKK